MNWALKQKTGGPATQIILYVIADSANEHGISIHADPDYIAERAQQSRTSVFHWLKELEGMNALTRIVRYMADGRRGYEIRLHLDQEINIPRRTRHDKPKAVESPEIASDADMPEAQDVEGESVIRTETKVQPLGHPEFTTSDSLKSPLKSPERERRARGAREDGKLSKLKGLWPTTAHDDQARIGRAWEDLTEPARDAAIERAPDWLENLKKIGRRHVPALWRYLEQELWAHMPEKARNGAIIATNASGYAPDSREGRALLTLARIGRYTLPRMGSGNIIFPREITAQMLAFAEAPRDYSPQQRGTGNYASYRDLLAKIFPRMAALPEVIFVPWPFPPRVDGSIGPPAQSTDPPRRFITDDDAQYMEREGL